MKTNRIVVILAVLAAAFTASAQQTEIKYEQISNSYTAVVTSPDKDESRYTVIKDPNSPLLGTDERMTGDWHELTQLGNKPWGSPAKSFAEIRKDPAVRGHIDHDTNLNAEQKSALYKALDDPALKVQTVTADQLPILAVFWGNGWSHSKVSFNLEAKFRKTEVYLFFVAETHDWYTFHSYCRNLGQPLAGFTFQAHAEEAMTTPPPPTPVVPKVEAPSCVKLERTDSKLFRLQVGQTAQLAASFSNPSGVDFAFRYVAIDKVTGEERPLSGNSATASITADQAVNYRIVVEGLYEGKPIQASACVLELSFFNPPAVKREPPAKVTSHKHKRWPYVVAAAIGTGIVVGYLESRKKSTPPSSAPVKNSACVPYTELNGTYHPCLN
jgi:hypothetical protein